MRQLTTPPIRRGAIAAFTTLAAVMAAGASMHTHAGMRLLARLGVPCPVNQVDPKKVLAVQQDAMARLQGAAAAPDRPALGLRLEQSTEVEVGAWAARTQTHCDAIERGFHYLRCRGVPAAALNLAGPAISEIWFSFGPAHTLLAINLYRRSMSPAETRQSWQSALQALHEKLGPPSQATGDLTLAALIEQPVAVARVDYRYRDYSATVTASHMPNGGLAVREQYLSATTAADRSPHSG